MSGSAEFATPRKTELVDAEIEIEDEALIEREDVAVTVTHAGYIKRTPLAEYRVQGRGGKGRSGMATRDEDFITSLFVANTHAPMLFFWGALDSHIPPDQVRAILEAMKEAKKTYVNVEFSDADHAFFCDARQAYKESAAKQSWDLSLRFLAEYVR